MKLGLTVIASLLLALSGTVASADPRLGEPLLGLRVNSDGITYYVYSGGCTEKSDFEVNILKSSPIQLQLIRLKPDICEVYVPDGVEIFFGWDEVGLQKGMPFRVNNPLQSFTVPG